MLTVLSEENQYCISVTPASYERYFFYVPVAHRQV